MAASRHRDYRDFDVVYPRSSGLFTAPGKGLATKAVQDRSLIMRLEGDSWGRARLVRDAIHRMVSEPVRTPAPLRRESYRKKSLWRPPVWGARTHRDRRQTGGPW